MPRKSVVLLPLALVSTGLAASASGVGTAAPVASVGQRPLATSLEAGSVTAAEAETLAAAERSAPIVPEKAIVASRVTDSAPEKTSVSRTAQKKAAPAATGLADIPAPALVAYQRARTVINNADPGCRLPWELLAAIGRVESHHGTIYGNVLDQNGVSRPGIYGIPLNGTMATRAIPDSDGGSFDNDLRWDRAVGPMQFIPSTWAVVAVDADGDGKRDPQDIDDATLGSAVYLCAGEEDLSTEAGQRAAVFRYNRSTAYVDQVLEIMRSYMSGDLTSLPTPSYPTSTTPSYTPASYQPPVSTPPTTTSTDTSGQGPSDDDSRPQGGPGGSGNGGAQGNGGQNDPKPADVMTPEDLQENLPPRPAPQQPIFEPPTPEPRPVDETVEEPVEEPVDETAVDETVNDTVEDTVKDTVDDGMEQSDEPVRPSSKPAPTQDEGKPEAVKDEGEAAGDQADVPDEDGLEDPTAEETAEAETPVAPAE